jgi:hypothetical protein
MKKVLLPLVGLSLVLAANTNFVQKYQVSLEMNTNSEVLKEITQLNNRLKNNKQCKINENISYVKNKSYPYNVSLNISCDTKNNKDINFIKNKIKQIVNNKNIQITEYSTQMYQATKEKYKNSQEFLEKHKDIINIMNKAMLMQQKLQKEMNKEFLYMQKLFEE